LRGKDEGEDGGPDPAEDGHKLAHKAAAIGEDGRQDDQDGDNAIYDCEIHACSPSIRAEHFTNKRRKVRHFAHLHPRAIAGF
jgi:hypothetical protein